MDRGDLVMIYENPITETNAEGQAVLHKPINEESDPEIWWVEFVDEPNKAYSRKIAKGTRPIARADTMRGMGVNR